MARRKWLLGYGVIPTWAYEKMIGRSMCLWPRKLFQCQTAAEVEAEKDPNAKVYEVWMEA